MRAGHRQSSCFIGLPRLKTSSDHPQLAAVVLAAGFSSRMRVWKPGLKINDTPLIVHSLIPALQVAAQIVLVGGFQLDELKKIVLDEKEIEASQKEKIIFVENEDYSAGMFSSVQVGLSRVHSSMEGAYVVPADMPLIDLETYKTLAAAFVIAPESTVFIPVLSIELREEKGEKRFKKGHPILLRRRVFPQILRENKSTSLRDVLKQFSPKLSLVRDPGISIDIDEESDLARLESQFQHKRQQENGPRL